MTTGKNHDKISKRIAWAFFGAGAFASGFNFDLTYLAAGAAASAGALSALALSPDLDTWSNSRRRWSNIGLGWLWEPYRLTFKHRSIFSHLPVLGTLIRLLWLATVITAFGYVASLVLPPIDAATVRPCIAIALPLVQCWAGALAFADLAHWVADRCPIGP